jgi:2-polyprenyl-3-methyl-5-hydroxy-6-metoxy-1,4-benzoquinol methylase
MMNVDGFEITDLLIDVDPVTLARRPVSKVSVIEALERDGMTWGAWIARSLPERDGLLDEAAIDALFVRVHAEMQRLWEEFLQGDRMRRLLIPLLRALRERGHEGPIRIVDVGCGLGYLVRWLTARGDLGADVEIVGCDYNRALIEAASRYARDEGLRCEFRVANAFTLDQPATVFISTGVLHHFRGEALDRFFAQQRHAAAFVHLDIKPSYLAPLGALIFHVARMREAVSQHDGTQSAVRAHSGERLLAAARSGESESSVALLDGEVEALPLLRTMIGVIRVRPDLRDGFVRHLGPLATRLGPWS